jgi:hypothetical protein
VEHEATIEVVMGAGSFKVSGSEKFIEKMIDVLPGLLPRQSSGEAMHGGGNGDLDAGKGGLGSEDGDIDEFVNKLNITDDTSGPKKVGAFVFFLTQVQKNASCTASQIEHCFDLTGLKTPENLNTVINDAKKSTRGGYIRSAGHGQYAVTTNGKNLVKEMTKGT